MRRISLSRIIPILALHCWHLAVGSRTQTTGRCTPKNKSACGRSAIISGESGGHVYCNSRSYQVNNITCMGGHIRDIKVDVGARIKGQALVTMDGSNLSQQQTGAHSKRDLNVTKNYTRWVASLNSN